jgi:hypothetical protein
MTEPNPASALGQFKNQIMINAVFAAAKELGQVGWGLLAKAGLAHLVFVRKQPYSGPDPEDLPNLTDEEKEAIYRKLVELVPEAKRRAGMTNAQANLYAGPGTEHPVLDVLPPRTRCELLDEEGDWLRIATSDKEGYVRRNFVVFDDQETGAGFLRTRPEFTGVPLEPPPEEALPEDPAPTGAAASALISTWNRCGGLLAVLANELKIDPAVAAAVFVTEAPGGRGFGSDGRMIIRFENHIFYDKWGKRNPEVFAQHFQFDAQKRWLSHQWRPTADEPWRTSHVNQPAEWAVFQFARTLDDSAAKLSISMGAPQIMGFNYTTVGYESVHQMFEAFSSNVRNQILGFFDFIKGPASTSARLQALQRDDFDTFAALYNGSGQAALYSGLIENRVEMFHQLRSGQMPESAMTAMPLAPTPDEVEEPGGMLETGAHPAMIQASEMRYRLSDLDPELYKAWRENAIEEFARNNQLVRRVLDLVKSSYTTTQTLYRVLLGVGIAFALAAIGLSLWRANAGFGLVFGGLTIAMFLVYFLSRPQAWREMSPELITWLGTVYNTYWTRVASLMTGESSLHDLAQAHHEATEEIQRIMAKHAELRKG